MGVASIFAKIASKPTVLTGVLGAAGGVGIMSLLGGGGSTEQTTAQTPASGDVYNTTNTPSNTYTYDYSQRIQTTNVIDSPFAGVNPDMSGGVESRIIPAVTTTTDTSSAADATTGTGLDMMGIGIIVAIALGGMFLLSGGLKK